jgi:hypothetical protein
MATGKILPSPLEDLPSDVLSVVLFHLSPKDIVSLGRTSKTLFTNVKVAKQTVLRTAQELVKSLSVTDTVVTFIEDLDKAIRYSYHLKSLTKEQLPTAQEFRIKLLALGRSYGYQFVELLSTSLPITGAGQVVTPSKIKLSFIWQGGTFFCIIESNEVLLARKRSEFNTYQFTKSFSLKFNNFSANKISSTKNDAHIKLTTGASLREILQVAADIGAVQWLYARWGMENFSIVDIRVEDTTGDPDEIQKCKDDKFSPSNLNIGATFCFLKFLIEKESSE